MVSSIAADSGIFPGQSTSALASQEPHVHDLAFAECFERDYDFVWRSLRRLGVVASAVDDAAQDVFVVASKRWRQIEAGKERAFLFGTAARMAANYRRKRSQHAPDEDSLLSVEHPGPSPHQSLQAKQERELLDRVLDCIPDGQREVFVLFELESMTMIEIASTLDLAPGTVASRLRRARARFQREVARLSVQREGSMGDV